MAANIFYFQQNLKDWLKTTYFCNLNDCPRIPLDYQRNLTALGYQTIVLTPIKNNNKARLAGVLVLYYKQEQDSSAEADLDLLEEAASKVNEGLELAERFQQVQETRLQLGQFLHETPDPIVTLDLEGRVQEWNEAAEQLFGYNAREIIGKHLPPVENDANEKRLYENVSEGVTLANVLMEKRHKEGYPLSLSVTLGPIVNMAGQVQGISLLVKDITENTRLKQEAARRNQEMTNLSEIALRLASSLDTNNLYVTINDYLNRLVEFDAIFAATYDEDKHDFEFQLHVEQGVYLAPERWAASETVLAWILQHGRQLVIDSSDNDFKLDCFNSLDGSSPVSLLLTPTKLEDRVSGFIAIVNYKPKPIKQYHKQLMVIVATQAAIALEKARILHRSQQKTEQLTILRQVAKVTSSSLELTDVLHHMVIELHRHIKFNWVYLQIFGPDGLYRQLDHDFKKGNKLPDLKFGSLGLSLMEVSQALLTALRFGELDRNIPSRERVSELLSSRRIQSGVVTPLWYGERCTGILMVGSSEDYLYSDDDMSLVNDIVNQTVGAIENALLHELVTTQVEQLALQSKREHKLLQQTAQERERLEAIFSNSSDGIILVDDQFNVLRQNSAMAWFTGTDHTLTKKCTEILRCQDKEGNLLCATGCPLQKVLFSREPLLNNEIRLDNQKGVHRTVSANWSLVASAEGGNNILATMRDVTVQREVEQMKANFISMVSHELRNPINVINGFTKMLAEGKAGELNPLQQEFIGSVLVSINQLKKLAEDILDLSRADSGRFSVKLGPVSLKETLLKSINNIKPMIYGKNIRLITGQLPDEDCLINGDELRLNQLIGNIFENAIKFTPQGGRIMVELKLEKDKATVSISDSGIGISPEHLSRIFERFYQVQDEETRRMRGTQLGSGLGLSICKEIVERHGGRIWATSSQGKGSTFSFSIPLLKMN